MKTLDKMHSEEKNKKALSAAVVLYKKIKKRLKKLM